MALNRTNMQLAIPDETSYEVIANVYGQSAVLQLADVRQMTAAVEDHVTGGDFEWPEGMENVAEGAAKPTVSGGLNSYQIVANKMAVFVIVTDELLKESAFDIIQYYRGAIEQQFAKLVDVHAIHGGGPFGDQSLVAAAANTVTVGDNGDLAGDFSALLGHVEDNDHAPNGFLSARRLKSQLRDLRDANQRPLYNESLTAETPDMLWGEPIWYLGRGVFRSQDGSVQSICADFSKYIVGIRDELGFSLHDEGIVNGINLLEENQTALRAEMRLGAAVVVDGGPDTANAFSVLRSPATTAETQASETQASSAGRRSRSSSSE